MTKDGRFIRATLEGDMRFAKALMPALVFVGSAIGPGCAMAQGGFAPSASIDAYAADKMRTARIPGLAVGVVKDGAVAYLKGFGRADPSGRPVTPQTPFLIGSITKPI